MSVSAAQRKTQPTASPEPVAHYLAQFERVRARLMGSGVPWMQRLRDAAASRFAESGFPSGKWEEWKYTNVQPIHKRAFESVAAGGDALGLDAVTPYRFEGLDAHTLVFVDGHFEPALSELGELPAGVTVEPIAQALPHHVDLFEMHLARYADVAANPFVALNTALMSDGVFVHLPADTVLQRPVHVLYLSATEGGMSHIRNLIVAERGSEATIVEHYAGATGIGYWTNAVTEIVAGENAGLAHYKLGEESDKAFHIATVETQQARDSRLTSNNVTLGGRLVRNDINTRLDGENAHCSLNGLYLSQGRQHVDNHTRIDHVKPHATSRELYKGVLDGWSRGVFNGKVVVHKYAQQTDSDQSNHSLLLSANAEADPKPQLEIFADDVKCTHGATVGQLDEDALYYLRSRGISESEARVLLTFAFANDVITHMRLEPVRARLEHLIKTRLPKGETLEEQPLEG